MKIHQIASTLILGAACAMPALAQSQGSGAPGQSSQPVSQPSTQPTQAPSTDTRTMGAGPAMEREAPRQENKRDLGWLGLLGLAGLLGLRRKHDDHDTRTHTEIRPGATR